jgi:hypothetical protein
LSRRAASRGRQRHHNPRSYGCVKMLKQEKREEGPLAVAAAEAPARPRDGGGSGNSKASGRAVPSAAAAAAAAEVAAGDSVGPAIEKFL